MLDGRMLNVSNTVIQEVEGLLNYTSFHLELFDVHGRLGYKIITLALADFLFLVIENCSSIKRFMHANDNSYRNFIFSFQFETNFNLIEKIFSRENKEKSDECQVQSTMFQVSVYSCNY